MYHVYKHACASVISPKLQLHAPSRHHGVKVACTDRLGCLHLNNAGKQPHRSAHSAIQHGDTALRTAERQRGARNCDRCVYEELRGQK